MKYRYVRSILRVFNQLLSVLMCRPVASSSRVPTDGMRNLSTVTSVPVQPQTPMQYRPAQSMPPSLTDAMRIIDDVNKSGMLLKQERKIRVSIGKLGFSSVQALVAFDLLRDALSAIFGLSELKVSS
ncbi:hypothetical protein Tco_0607627 [Tanacetum coccineum]